MIGATLARLRQLAANLIAGRLAKPKANQRRRGSASTGGKYKTGYAQGYRGPGVFTCKMGEALAGSLKFIVFLRAKARTGTVPPKKVFDFTCRISINNGPRKPLVDNN